MKAIVAKQILQKIKTKFLSPSIIACHEDDEYFQSHFSTQSYEGALLVYKTNLKWGQAFSLFMFVKHGPNLPIELHRDDMAWRLIFYSAAPYALGLDEITSFELLEPAIQSTALLA